MSRRRRAGAGRSGGSRTRRGFLTAVGVGALGVAGGSVIQSESFTAASVSRAANTGVTDDANAVVRFQSTGPVQAGREDQLLATVGNDLGTDVFLRVEPAPGFEGSLDSGRSLFPAGELGREIRGAVPGESPRPYEFVVSLDATDDSSSATLQRSVRVTAPEVDPTWEIDELTFFGDRLVVGFEQGNVPEYDTFEVVFRNEAGETATARPAWYLPNYASIRIDQPNSLVRPGDTVYVTLRVFYANGETYVDNRTHEVQQP